MTDFLTVSPKLGTLIDNTSSAGAALPEYFYINWKDKLEPFIVWWREGSERITHTIDPGFTPQTVASGMLERSDLLISRWPELYFVFYSYDQRDPSSRIRAVNVFAGGPSESLQLGAGSGPISSAFSTPFAHPNGKVYWTARNPAGGRDVMVWEPPGAAVILTSLDTASNTMSFHRTTAGDDLLIHYNTSAPASSYMVDLHTGTTSNVATHSFVNHGIYSFADPSVDLLPGQFGGAYGKSGFSLRGSYEHETLGYALGRARFASSDAAGGILSNSTLRFNASRKAIACYHFQSPASDILKWFDISQDFTAPVNSDATMFQEPAPLLDPDDPDSFPDQIYPAAVEPFA